MAPNHKPLPAIPLSFATKKANILDSLASPSYTDASPKGSVDTGIKELIDKINRLDGIVTTSSCAGRISVFLEGAEDVPTSNGVGGGQGRKVSPGGKGGGQWLFVSHDPLDFRQEEGTQTLTSRFGLSPYIESAAVPSANARVVRFQYEPLILHILCASLAHAQPILAAAISSGFRESGVQSLKNLDDTNALPMVAIRSHGLALESMIGVYSTTGEKPVSLVNEGYLKMLVNIANQRFEACEERKKRFEGALFNRQRGNGGVHWEDTDLRKERKRQEGLKKKEQMVFENNGLDVVEMPQDIDHYTPNLSLIQAFEPG